MSAMSTPSPSPAASPSTEWPSCSALDATSALVVNVARGEECDVYIGRTFAGRRDQGWGNPIRAGHGDAARRRAVVGFFHWLQGPSAQARSLRARIRAGELTDRRLGCWCASDPWWETPCHGHVLAALANRQVPALKAWIAALERLDARRP